jgi:uncharacterized RDD family membrane protein YckC
MNTASFAKRLAAGLIDVVILYTILQLIFFVTFFFAPRDIFSQLFIAVPWILLLQFQTNGSEITFGQSVIRYVGFILSILPLFLGFIWILFDEQNQGWHDKIAKTIVISEEERKRNNKKRP